MKNNYEKDNEGIDEIRKRFGMPKTKSYKDYLKDARKEKHDPVYDLKSVEYSKL